MPTSPVAAAPSDFDFIIGHWLVRHRRLEARLRGCTEWYEFEGRSTTHKILGGFGNVEDNVLVIGRFDGSVGLFLGDDTLEGRPIKMRFTWRVNPGGNPTWEQAFSDDGGTTWETNWTMEFERREASQYALQPHAEER